MAFRRFDIIPSWLVVRLDESQSTPVFSATALPVLDLQVFHNHESQLQPYYLDNIHGYEVDCALQEHNTF